MGRSLFRRTFSLKNGLRLAFGLLVATGGLMLAKAWWDSRVFEGYDPDLPLRPEIVSQGELDGYTTEKVLITGLAGERIPLRIIRPHLSPGKKAPCVIFLYGIGQSAQFFDQIASIFASQGFAMAMPEQYHCGERRRRDIGVFRKALAIRERCSRIVPETRRLVDFLSQAPGIDEERISLIGASYGGIMASSVLVAEPRIQRAALVMAGGDLSRLLDSLVQRYQPEPRLLAPAAAKVAAWLLRPFEPLDFIGQVAPRPLLFLGVSNDELIDPSCVKALYEAAGHPKEKINYEGVHAEISESTVRQMLTDALQWLRG